MPRVPARVLTPLRLGLGSRVVALGPRPRGALRLYDFEACPFCRKAREAISMLDLDVDIRPCPKLGTRFRPELAELVRRVKVPVLVDEDPSRPPLVVSGSDAIIEHLFSAYGQGPPPWQARLGALGTWTSGVVSGGQLGRGLVALGERGSRPARRYGLVSNEPSAEARVVRERLCELEIPYRWLSCAAGSKRAREGQAVPTLLDLDTEQRWVGARAILAQLEAEPA